MTRTELIDLLGRNVWATAINQALLALPPVTLKWVEENEETNPRQVAGGSPCSRELLGGGNCQASQSSASLRASSKNASKSESVSCSSAIRPANRRLYRPLSMSSTFSSVNVEARTRRSA